MHRGLAVIAVLASLVSVGFSQGPTITEYSIPTAGSGPYGIVAGPDGALWFTELFANKIGRITTSGAITEYAIPPLNFGGGTPNDITAGPDGALWFGETTNIGRI